MRHDCGGFATCSTCRVFVHEGMSNLSAVDLDEENMLEEANLPAPFRLSCQTKIAGDVVVVIDNEMDWSKGAFRFLDEIPETNRRIARMVVEKKARQLNHTAILPDFASPELEAVKKKLEEVSGSPEDMAAFTKELYES